MLPIIDKGSLENNISCLQKSLPHSFFEIYANGPFFMILHTCNIRLLIQVYIIHLGYLYNMHYINYIQKK